MGYYLYYSENCFLSFSPFLYNMFLGPLLSQHIQIGFILVNWVLPSVIYTTSNRCRLFPVLCYYKQCSSNNILQAVAIKSMNSGLKTVCI